LARAAGAAAPGANANCPGPVSGLTLPPGFCATVFADDIGHARHLVVAPNGVVYVNTWSGRYYGNDTPHAGGFLVALQDTDESGTASLIGRFGETAQSGGAGGTGIGLYKGALYAEINDKIVRYPLPTDSILPRGRGEAVVTGLPLGGDHPGPPLVLEEVAVQGPQVGVEPPRRGRVRGVVARGKGAPGPGEEDHPAREIGGERPEQSQELVDRGRREGVEARLPVEGDPGDAVDRRVDEQVGHGHLRSGGVPSTADRPGGGGGGVAGKI